MATSLAGNKSVWESSLDYGLRTLRLAMDTHAIAQSYGFTDLDGSQPDAWRYITEVREAGKPATPPAIADLCV